MEISKLKSYLFIKRIGKIKIKSREGKEIAVLITDGHLNTNLKMCLEDYEYRDPNKLFSIQFRKFIEVSYDDLNELVVYEYSGFIKINNEFYDCEFDCIFEDVEQDCLYEGVIKIY